MVFILIYLISGILSIILGRYLAGKCTGKYTEKESFSAETVFFSLIPVINMAWAIYAVIWSIMRRDDENLPIVSITYMIRRKEALPMFTAIYDFIMQDVDSERRERSKTERRTPRRKHTDKQTE